MLSSKAVLCPNNRYCAYNSAFSFTHPSKSCSPDLVNLSSHRFYFTALTIFAALFWPHHCFSQDKIGVFSLQGGCKINEYQKTRPTFCNKTQKFRKFRSSEIQKFKESCLYFLIYISYSYINSASNSLWDFLLHAYHIEFSVFHFR